MSAVTSSCIIRTWRQVVTKRIQKYNARCFASSSNNGPSSSSSRDNMEDYLTSLGIQTELHKDLLLSIRPLVGAAAPEENVTVAKLTETFATNDIIALSSAIELQQKKRQQKANRKRPQRPKREVIFRIPQHGNSPDHQYRESTLTWRFGESLLDLAQSVPGQKALADLSSPSPNNNNTIMEGPCGGQMNCSTCHVYLDPSTYNALEPLVEAELDMLDLAYEVNETSSRLGCQVKLNDNLINNKGGEEEHVIVVTLPFGVNNQWT